MHRVMNGNTWLTRRTDRRKSTYGRRPDMERRPTYTTDFSFVFFVPADKHQSPSHHQPMKNSTRGAAKRQKIHEAAPCTSVVPPHFCLVSPDYLTPSVDSTRETKKLTVCMFVTVKTDFAKPQRNATMPERRLHHCTAHAQCKGKQTNRPAHSVHTQGGLRKILS